MRQPSKAFVSTAVLGIAALALTACSGAPKTEQSADAEETVVETEVGQSGEASATITIEDNHGPVELTVPPTRVVALDNTALRTLADWNVELVAAPFGVMGEAFPEYSDSAEILDVGNHREPNLEAVIEANPDLIIGGYRFADYYDDLKKIQPNTIEIEARDGQDRVEELKRQTTILGEIFGRQADAEQLNAALDEAVGNAKAAYNGTDTVVGLITSGGEIAYAAPGEGRGVGLLFPTLGLTSGIDQAAEDASHGDDISVEAIAAANPEWLIVLDRDGALTSAEEGYVPAAELIEGSEALAEVPAVKKGQVIYLDSNFYLDEGIQAYTQLFTQVSDAFSKAK